MGLTSHRELSLTIVKAGIYRRTCDQPIFPNSLASPIIRSHTLRLLVAGFSKDDVYRERLTTALDLKNSIRHQINNIHVDSLLSAIDNGSPIERVLKH
ncbi:hypothetical protein TNCV_3483521 [Trichonephila clavipes]|nr:hypothetical protein TNCV_3483521 [Trichonephila clavipes]